MEKNKIYVGREVFFAAVALLTLAGVSSGHSLYTPKGSRVLHTHAEREWTSSEIAEIRAYVAANFPNAEEREAPTTQYNCHSQAWGNCNGIIDGQHVAVYVTDGSYAYDANSALWTWGAATAIPEHSGIRSNYDCVKGTYMVVSKMGLWGLYKHPENEHPYGGGGGLHTHSYKPNW